MGKKEGEVKCKWLGGKPVNCHLPEEIRCEWIENKTIFECVTVRHTFSFLFYCFLYLLNATALKIKRGNLFCSMKAKHKDTRA